MDRFTSLSSKLVGKVIMLPARFNMLHRGHEAYIEAVLRCRPLAVYVFLGRCNAFRIPTDPFDDVERRCMIESFSATLARSDSEKLHLFPIFNRKTGALDWTPDEVDDWYRSCADLLRSRGLRHWDVVISGNHYTGSYSGDIEFVSPYDLVSAEDQVYVDGNMPVFASRVRQLFYAGDEAWADLVSERTARIVRHQIDAYPMAVGPMDAVRHRVRVNGTTLDGDPFCVTRVVEDGEFKDQVAIEELGAVLGGHGASVELAASRLVPYAITGRIARGAERFEARVALRSVIPASQGDALEYTFECSLAPVAVCEDSAAGGWCA